MIDRIPDIKEEIYRSERTIISRGIHPERGEWVVKQFQGDDRSMGVSTRFHNEERVQTLLSGEDELGVFEDNGLRFLVRRYYPGKSLETVIRENKLTLDQKLTLFIAACNALRPMHALHLVHKDISPGNLIVASDPSQVSWIDFELSTDLSVPNRMLQGGDSVEGTVPYLSPEQTGRVSRTVDHRSDFYSLGAVMFELFTGRVVFEGTDVLAQIHAHLAVIPDPAHVVKPDVPEQISAILAMLLEKEPEKRYQSIDGLIYDLERCQLSLKTEGFISSFPTGTRDLKQHLLIPEKLYGREKEQAELERMLHECVDGKQHLVYILGKSGVGKTSLVNELITTVALNQGVFVSSKFDQLQRNTPYHGWKKVLDDIVDQLLSAQSSERDRLSRSLAELLGPLGAALIPLVPRLEILLGRQQPLPDLFGLEEQNRFTYAISLLMEGICSMRRPVVVFIDDWQWADQASIDLWQNLMNRTSLKGLMMICAVRNQKLDAGHPFIKAQRELMAMRAEPSVEIRVESLFASDVKNMLRDTLQTEPSEELTNLIFEKTRGNCFFVKQLLQKIYEEKHIKYETEKGGWAVNLEGIQTINISENVAEFMEEKLRRYPLSTLEMLTMAACIGNRFEIGLLCTVSGRRAPMEVVHLLWTAMEDGLLVPENPAFKPISGYFKDHPKVYFRFAHDRVQQAAYGLMPEANRKLTHRQIGKFLLDEGSYVTKEDWLFELVNHLNKGESWVTPAERKQIQQLNQEAGQKARKSVAFVQALYYYEQSIDLLESKAWNEEYADVLRLYEQFAEAAYVCSQEEALLRAVDQMEEHAKNVLDKTLVIEYLVKYFFNNKQHSRSAEIGLKALRDLGVRFPEKPGKGSIILSVVKTKMALPAKKLGALTRFPLMTDPQQLAIMRMCSATAPGVLSSLPNVYPLIINTAVQRSVKYGNCPDSVLMYGSFGIVLSGILGELENGSIIGKQLMPLAESLKAKEVEAPARFIHAFFLQHWYADWSVCTEELEKGFRAGLQQGDYLYGIFCHYIKSFFLYSKDATLEKALEHFQESEQLAAQFHQETVRNYCRMYIAHFRNMNRAAEKSDSEEEYYAAFKSLYTQTNDKIGLTSLAVMKLWEDLMLGKFDESDGLISDFLATQESILGTANAGQVPLALSGYMVCRALAQNKALSSAEKKSIKGYLGQMRKWSKFAPLHHLPRLRLAEALLALQEGRYAASVELFHEAIPLIKKSRATMEQCLALEYLAIALQKAGKVQEAQRAAEDAVRVYLEWGCFTKVDMLTKKWFKTSSSLSAVSSTQTGTSTHQFDLLSIVKSVKAISGEILLDQLLGKMMHILIENAGAQNGYFILPLNDAWVVAAEVHADGTQRVSVGSEHIENHSLIPNSLVEFVMATQQMVLLQDSADRQRFAHDPWFRSNQPRSLACIPFINQGKVSGIVLLRNDLLEQAFTSSRVEVLNILSGQIAISLDNAILYNNLEQKVKERTAELAEEKKKTDDLLLNILPQDVAEELKASGKAKARRFDDATVLFADFKNFTSAAERLSPEELVSTIDEYYKLFDQIVTHAGVEKIKTVGDCYICVSGVPVPVEKSANIMLDVAKTFLTEMAKMNHERQEASKVCFDLRIGMHTGPVVAGVVGTRKFAYDIWGDTVNTAARMEQHGEAGKINISGATFERLGNPSSCIHRGKVSAKNKGEIDMYWA